jgi:hypothetical protein
MLEADADDIVFEEGKAFVRGSPESAKTIQEITGAAVAYDPQGEELTTRPTTTRRTARSRSERTSPSWTSTPRRAR